MKREFKLDSVIPPRKCSSKNSFDKLNETKKFKDYFLYLFMKNDGKRDARPIIVQKDYFVVANAFILFDTFDNRHLLSSDSPTSILLEKLLTFYIYSFIH